MKQITVVIRGGAVWDVAGVPKGVEVKIVDYDVDGSETGMLVDHDGEPARVEIWEGPH